MYENSYTQLLTNSPQYTFFTLAVILKCNALIIQTTHLPSLITLHLQFTDSSTNPAAENFAHMINTYIQIALSFPQLNLNESSKYSGYKQHGFETITTIEFMLSGTCYNPVPLA
jgi:hypothetical protein